jgi:hypothetical protein
LLPERGPYLSMGVGENIDSGFSRIRCACAVYEHATICLRLPLSRSISRIFRFSAGTRIFLDVYPQQSFEEAA